MNKVTDLQKKMLQLIWDRHDELPIDFWTKYAKRVADTLRSKDLAAPYWNDEKHGYFWQLTEKGREVIGVQHTATAASTDEAPYTPPTPAELQEQFSACVFERAELKCEKAELHMQLTTVTTDLETARATQEQLQQVVTAQEELIETQRQMIATLEGELADAKMVIAAKLGEWQEKSVKALAEQEAEIERLRGAATRAMDFIDRLGENSPIVFGGEAEMYHVLRAALGFDAE